MVGVAVVSLFTVFAGSLKSSIQDSTGRAFGGDLAITTPGFGGGALNPRLAERVGALPEIDDAVGLGQGAARIAGESEPLTVADPAALARVADLDVAAGSLGGLGARGLAVSSSFAEEHGWRTGSRVPLTFADETRDAFTVAAIYDNDELTGDVLMSRSAWAPHASQDLDTVVYLTVAAGDGTCGGAGRRAARRARRRQPGRADAPGVHRRLRGRDRRAAGDRLRPAAAGDRDRVDGDRQHAVALDPRAHARARAAARRRRQPPAAALDDPRRVADHRRVRDDRRPRARRVPRLGARARDVRRRGAERVLRARSAS